MIARILRHAALLVAPAAAIAALGGGPNPPAFRLPDLASPVRYEARLEIDPRAPDFAGEIAIDVRLERATDVLWLNATALAIERAELRRGDAHAPLAVVPGGEDFVGLKGRFDAGPATLRIAYRGKLDALLVDGIFRQQERGDWYAITQFQPIGARRAFPCFDEPGWKTPWRLTIDAPGANVVVSNTPQTSATEIASRPGWWRHEFAETRPLPSYLVGLAVGPFEVVDGGTAGRKETALRYLVPRGRGDEVRYAAAATPRLLERLEEYFGTPYPFEKLDAVTIPHLVTFGAMENVGMITYGSQFLLARAHEETQKFREGFAGLAAHEMAHMWFGNLVTLKWWDDTWLNEAFASWIGTRVTYEFQPAWDNGAYRSATRASALAADRLATARRIHDPVESRNAIDDAFDDITYSKGEEVLSMFEKYFGPERFRAGVRAFLARHAWGSATSADFFRALGEASGSPAAAVRALSGFVDQPGAPLVDVALDCSGKPALVVGQRRLRPKGSRAPELQWTTPACFRYRAAAKDATECVAIEASTRRVELAQADACPGWIVGNAGGLGHYVVRYEDGLLKRIAERAGSLPPFEAQVLAKDTLLLADAGLVPPSSALVVAEAALGHESPAVELAGVGALRGLRDEWLGESARREKARIVAQRALPRARELGWEPRAGEPDDVKALRAELMRFAADRPEGAELRAPARAAALRWIDDARSVDASIARSVLEVAGRFADRAMFDKLEAAALASDSFRDHTRLLHALARARDPRLRDRALALTLAAPGGKPRIDGRSALTLLHAALEDDETRPAAFDYVRANLPAIEAKLPRDTVASLLVPMGRLCTGAQRTALAAAFRDRAPRYMTGPLRYAQALESVDLCVASHLTAATNSFVFSSSLSPALSSPPPMSSIVSGP